MDEGYDSGTTDFAPFINKIQQANPEVIMGGGHFQDGSTFARQLFEKNVSVKFLSLLVAPPEPTFAEIGDAAVGVIGPSQWEPGVAYNEAAAKALIENVLKRFERIDVLVNCASIWPAKPLEEVTAADVRRVHTYPVRARSAW